MQEELLQRISRKLDVLRAEDMALKEEMTMNEELGGHVSSLVMIINKWLIFTIDFLEIHLYKFSLSYSKFIIYCFRLNHHVPNKVNASNIVFMLKKLTR